MNRAWIAVIFFACGTPYSDRPSDPPDASAENSSAAVAVPDGWLAVTIAPPSSADAGTVCPAYWTAPRRLRSRPHIDVNQCSCSCGEPSGNPCLTGETIDIGYGTGTATTCTGVKHVVNDGTCQYIDWPTSITHGSGPVARAPKNLTCTATSTLAPILDDGESWACTSPAPTPCPSGPGSCVTKPASAKVCLLHGGEVDCPAAGQTRQVVYPDEGVVDQRTCPCSCQTTATSCTKPHITLFTDTLCTQSPVIMSFDGTCRSAPSIMANAARYIYSAVPNTTACVPDAATATATGDLKLEPQTLCCAE